MSLSSPTSSYFSDLAKSVVGTAAEFSQSAASKREKALGKSLLVLFAISVLLVKDRMPPKQPFLQNARKSLIQFANKNFNLLNCTRPEWSIGMLIYSCGD